VDNNNQKRTDHLLRKAANFICYRHEEISVAREEVVVVEVERDRQMHATVHERNEFSLKIGHKRFCLLAVRLERELLCAAGRQFVHPRQ